jgi:hypothetical protein
VSKSDEVTALAERGDTSIAAGPWSGDRHRMLVEAAAEAGLDVTETELESYTEGFKQGMTLDDPSDHAIVLRGRTVLKRAQMSRSLKPMLRFLKLAPDDVALQIHDGGFELRVSGRAAEAAAPAMDSAKVALRVWIAAGLVGLVAMQFSDFAAAITWGLGLMTGGWTLRQGLLSGRAVLAARLTLGLAMLAQEERLVLPPAGDA